MTARAAAASRTSTLPRSAMSLSFLDWFDRSTESAHPVFGKINSGMDVCNKINNAPCDGNDLPKTPIKMISVTVA
jgi:cyclophilin family peptidyl-prolyl cis-trans isomerase